MKEIDIHSPAAVSAEVELLRADKAELEYLTSVGALRPWCFEVDLRIAAYNSLTNKKFAV